MKKIKLIIYSSLLLFSVAVLAADNSMLKDYTTSIIGQYMTPDQYADFRNSATIKAERNESTVAEGKILTIDTRDQESCLALSANLNFDKEICHIDNDAPFASLVMMRNADQGDFERKITLDGLSKDQRAIVEDVRNLTMLGVGSIGLIYSMPASVSKWDKEALKNDFFGKYKINIAKGPVIDGDDWQFNYIGHPISGAIYYTMVRHQGFGKLQSFTFAAAMSTFFWEYGLEAVAEVPSIQDLLITPIMGSILGEVFYQASLTIEANNGKLLGSKVAGTVATVLMNPAGAVSKQVNKVLGNKYFKSSELDFVLKTDMQPSVYTYKSDYAGLRLKFTF